MLFFIIVAFKIYDIDKDGFIGNGELFQVLKTMVGNNLTDKQLQQIVDKTILYADKDGDGKISFDEFCSVSLKHVYNITKLLKNPSLNDSTRRKHNYSCVF